MFVGARPNFMKAAPLCEEFDVNGIAYTLYNSGQHYDQNLNQVFTKRFKFKNIQNMNCAIHANPVVNLQEIINQTKTILIEHQHSVRGVIVFGDVITTYAVALAATQLGFPLVHVEAGLRSFDISMPEELIRVGVDHMSHMLFCPSQDAVDNLHKEGKYNHVYMVGNIMIDCLKHNLHLIHEHKLSSQINLDLNSPYVLATFHRPENVDRLFNLNEIVDELIKVNEMKRVFFPAHPRTIKALKILNVLDKLTAHNIHIMEPLDYFDFMKLMVNASAVVTDSGGIQEETTFLRIPCFTVRRSTERPVTILEGTNKLIGINQIASSIQNMKPVTKKPFPELWDGRTSMRIANEIVKLI